MVQERLRKFLYSYHQSVSGHPVPIQVYRGLGLYSEEKSHLEGHQALAIVDFARPYSSYYMLLGIIYMVNRFAFTTDKVSEPATRVMQFSYICTVFVFL